MAVDIDKLAARTSLTLSAEEKKMYAAEVESWMDYMGVLRSVDPAQPKEYTPVWKEDGHEAQ